MNGDTFRSRAPVHGDDLEHATADLVDLMPRVQALLPVKGAGTTVEGSGHSKGRKFVYPVPWNTPAANLLLTVHQGVRDHELNLCLLLFGGVKFRGSSDDNTIQALHRVPVLIRAAVNRDLADHQYVTDAIIDLIRWPQHLRRFLDDEPKPGDPTPWTKAPGNLTCPHCDHRLWLIPGWQHHGSNTPVICRRCKGDDGRLLEWPADAWLAVLQEATS